MGKNTNLLTIILAVSIGFLIFASFFISSKLKEDDKTASAIVPVKTKAAGITYSRYIALNTTGYQADTTDTSPTPTSSLSLTPSPSSGSTKYTSGEANPSISPTPTDGKYLAMGTSPSPTDVIVAYNNPTSIIQGDKTASASPTKTKSLPSAGNFSNLLILFAAGSLIIFFSFLY